MSNPTTIECVLAFNTREGVWSTTLQVTVGPPEEAKGLFAALEKGERLTIPASALHFYDREFTFAGHPAAQYRPVKEFKP